eukprot:364018-Chlamydomonas_euryale.AAC.3
MKASTQATPWAEAGPRDLLPCPRRQRASARWHWRQLRRRACLRPLAAPRAGAPLAALGGRPHAAWVTDMAYAWVDGGGGLQGAGEAGIWRAPLAALGGRPPTTRTSMGMCRLICGCVDECLCGH